MSGDTGQRTVFMLGIAGMGLAVAMFADGIKKSKRPIDVNEKTEDEQVIPEIIDTKVQESTEDEKNGEPEQETEVEEVSSQPIERESETKQDTEEPYTEEPTKNPPDSYVNYFKKQKQVEEMEKIKNLPDYSYKGNGSRWDKKKYFIMEAYRRSREMTPVCPTLIAKAQVDKVLQDEDSTDYSEESDVSEDYTDESEDEKTSDYETQLYAEAKKASEERKIKRRNDKVMNMV